MRGLPVVHVLPPDEHNNTPIETTNSKYLTSREKRALAARITERKYRHFWHGNQGAPYFAGAPAKQPEASSALVINTDTQQTEPVSRPAATDSRRREQEAAAAIRSARTTREELQLKYPELNQAVFQHLAAHDQFADAFVQKGLIRESDRAQVIAQLHERLADKLERGTRIREPDDKQVNTLIRRSVNRVAADIGRSPVEATPGVPEHTPRAPIVREDIQVRG